MGVTGTSGGPEYGEGKKALLQAVIRVTSNKGLRGVTYRAVAEEAGVTHGLVAHHFGSRDALIEEALNFAVDVSLAQSQLQSQVEGFDRFAAELLGSVDLDPDVQAFQYELILESRRRAELLPLVERLYNSYRQGILEELTLNGLADLPLANLVLAATDGLVLQQLAFGRSHATDQALAVLRDVLRLYSQAQTS